MDRFALANALGLASALALAAACGPSPPAMTPAQAIEQWDRNHPQAAQELGEWVRAHPDAAAKFFEWDGHHPEKSKEFVLWTLANPGANIDAFVATHPGWPVFDRIMENHRPAAEAFMAWARRHPPAAQSL